MNERSLTVLDSLRCSGGFNDMNPRLIAEELFKIKDFLDDVFWTKDRSDTVLVFYRCETMNIHRAVRRVELAGHRAHADELDVMTTDEALEILTLGYRGKLSEEDQIMFDEMAKDHPRVVRLWWD